MADYFLEADLGNGQLGDGLLLQIPEILDRENRRVLDDDALENEDRQHVIHLVLKDEAVLVLHSALLVEKSLLAKAHGELVDERDWYPKNGVLVDAHQDNCPEQTNILSLVILDDHAQVGELPVASEVEPRQDVGPNDDVDDNAHQVRLLLDVRDDHDRGHHNPRDPVRQVPLFSIVHAAQRVSDHKQEVNDQKDDAADLEPEKPLLVILKLLGLGPLTLESCRDVVDVLLVLDQIVEVGHHGLWTVIYALLLALLLAVLMVFGLLRVLARVQWTMRKTNCYGVLIDNTVIGRQLDFN